MEKRSGLKLNKYSISAIVISAFVIQTIIIAYNQYTGFISIGNLFEAAFRLFFATAVSIGISIIAFIFNTQMISFLDKEFSWDNRFFTRVILEFTAAVTFAAAFISLITILLNIVAPYEGSILKHVFNNILIFAVINIIYVAILEAIVLYKNWKREMVLAERLKKENALAVYEALKNQVNPHFLFNSLNVLSSIVKKDPEKAIIFIQEFSSIYRYILDSSDKIVVQVSEEIEFLNSYLYLMKMRHGEGLNCDIKLNSHITSMYIVPLSLQILAENVFKHNIISSSKPITIKIYDEAGFIIMENDIIKKDTHGNSTGKGLENLRKRYSFISEEKTVFLVHNNKFIAKIPVIDAE